MREFTINIGPKDVEFGRGSFHWEDGKFVPIQTLGQKEPDKNKLWSVKLTIGDKDHSVVCDMKMAATFHLLVDCFEDYKKYIKKTIEDVFAFTAPEFIEKKLLIKLNLE